MRISEAHLDRYRSRIGSSDIRRCVTTPTDPLLLIVDAVLAAEIRSFVNQSKADLLPNKQKNQEKTMENQRGPELQESRVPLLIFNNELETANNTGRSFSWTKG